MKKKEKKDIEAGVEAEAEAVTEEEDPAQETEDITKEAESPDPAQDLDHTVIEEETTERATQDHQALEAEEVCQVEISHQRDMKRGAVTTIE